MQREKLIKTWTNWLNLIKLIFSLHSHTKDSIIIPTAELTCLAFQRFLLKIIFFNIIYVWLILNS